MIRALVPSAVRLWTLLASLLLAVACSGPSTPLDPTPLSDVAPLGARRVVSLVPAVTETILALGAGDRLVGIGRFDPDVPRRPDLPRLGDAFSVSLEALAALEPDLVLVNAAAVAARLEPLAVRCRILTMHTDTLSQTRASVLAIGEELQLREAGARLVESMDAEVAAARGRLHKRFAQPRPGAPAATSARSPLRVLVVLQHRPLYVAGAGSYVHELIKVVGGSNVAGDLDAAWPTLSEEALAGRTPDVILDASAGVEQGVTDAEILSRWSDFDTLPAVMNERVVVVRSDSLFRPGPRLGEALRELEALLYGGSDER